MDARTYANTYLFKPLGIPEVAEQDWNTDPSGVTNGIAGLYLTPRDLAKFGYLYSEERQLGWAAGGTSSMGGRVYPRAGLYWTG